MPRVADSYAGHQFVGLEGTVALRVDHGHLALQRSQHVIAIGLQACWFAVEPACIAPCGVAAGAGHSHRRLAFHLHLHTAEGHASRHLHPDLLLLIAADRKGSGFCHGHAGSGCPEQHAHILRCGPQRFTRCNGRWIGIEETGTFDHQYGVRFFTFSARIFHPQREDLRVGVVGIENINNPRLQLADLGGIDFEVAERGQADLGDRLDLQGHP